MYPNSSDAALTLARHVIATKAPHANLVLSPVSIHVVLGLIAAGSKGPAREHVLGFLNSKSIEEDRSLVSKLVETILTGGGAPGGPVLAFANGIWVDQSLTPKTEFDGVVKTCYKADLTLVDFQTRAAEVARTVNEWAENTTNGLIKDILPPGSVDASTQLILANALYFKGLWTEEFDPSQTKECEFHLLNNTSVQVPFMANRHDQYVEAYDGFKVLRLPYKQGQGTQRRFSMYIYLPDARDGLPYLVRRVGSLPGFIDGHVPSKQVKVGDFRIPKFKIEFGFEASEVLKGMGLVLGGLTEIVNSSALYVSSIFHKSCIEVNEEGTEAAAVTAIVKFGSSMYQVKRIDFVADHPFLFVVREDVSGLILFVGQVVDPR